MLGCKGTASNRRLSSFSIVSSATGATGWRPLPLNFNLAPVTAQPLITATHHCHSSPLGRNHFRDSANAGVACIQVVLLVHDPVAGFGELAGTYTHSVTNRTDYFAIPV